MQGTDAGISKKKNFPVFYGSLRLKKEGKMKFLFCKVRHFVNFPKFTKSPRQYLGNLFTSNEVFSFQKTDAYSIWYTVWVCHFEKVSFPLRLFIY